MGKNYDQKNSWRMLFAIGGIFVINCLLFVFVRTPFANHLVEETDELFPFKQRIRTQNFLRFFFAMVTSKIFIPIQKINTYN